MEEPPSGGEVPALEPVLGPPPAVELLPEGALPSLEDDTLVEDVVGKLQAVAAAVLAVAPDVALAELPDGKPDAALEPSDAPVAEVALAQPAARDVPAIVVFASVGGNGGEIGWRLRAACL